MPPILATPGTVGDARSAQALLRELVATHDRFPALFDDHPAGMVLLDRNGNLVRANRATLTYLGVGIDDLIGRRYGSFIERSQRDNARLEFNRAAAGQTVEVATRVTIATGDIVSFTMTLAPAVVERTIVGIYATAQSLADAPTRKLQELTSLFANTADAVIVFDGKGRCVDANAASEKITGYPAAELRGRHYRSLLATDARLAARDVFARVLAGESVSTDTVFVARGGRRIDVSGTSVPIVVDGAVVGAYTIGRDVTAARCLEADLREQTERMRELYLLTAAIDDSVETQIVAALGLGCRRLHCDAGYVTRGHSDGVTFLYSIGDVRHAAGSNEPLEGSLHAFVHAHGEAVVGRTDGADAFIGAPIDFDGERAGALCFVRTRPQERSFTAADRDFVGLIGTHVSSTMERGEQRRRADMLAFFDPLTGLPNRTLLSDRLNHAIVSAGRHPDVFAVHFYDLDNFKAINDDHGHMRGDEVLCAVARRLERVARQEDTVARIGGDEFVVLQPGVHSRDDVETLARRLQATLAEPIAIGGSSYRLTASGGVALYPADGRDPETLLARADAAMYRVKQRGRDDVAFFSPPS